MLEHYIENFKTAKNHLKQEIDRFPDKEHELTLMYSPVINYHAVRCVEQLLNDMQYGLKYELVSSEG